MRRTDEPGEKGVDRHADELAALLRAVLESPGLMDPTIRAMAYQGDQLPSPIREYVARVRGESYRITDDDVRALLAAGYSQDAVFELTVAAALGAAMRQLEAGLRALGEAR